MSTSSSVIIYTDGACIPNPGSGGWAAILIYEHLNIDPSKNIIKRICGSDPYTTSNGMELQAAIEALKILKRPCFVKLVTDSRYLYDGVNHRLPIWRKLNWKLEMGRIIKNVDLWKQLDVLLKTHQVKVMWTKGHSKNPWNEEVDQLARSQIEYPQIVMAPDLYYLFVQTACIGTTGGWGSVLLHGNEKSTLSGVEVNTTANRSEIIGVLAGLCNVPKNAELSIITHSTFIYSSMVKHLSVWEKNRWQTTESREVKHRDLWEQVLVAKEGKNVKSYLARDDRFANEFQDAKEIAVKRLRAFLDRS